MVKSPAMGENSSALAMKRSPSMICIRRPLVGSMPRSLPRTTASSVPARTTPCPWTSSPNPPKGMVSPRGPIFAALIARVEAPDPNTVVIHGKGPSGLLLPLFANGWNVIIPKHIAEKDPVNALKTTVIGTGPFRLKEPPTSSLWKYERNPEYFKKELPFLDEVEIHIITDPQAVVAAILSKRVFWSDSFPHPNMDRDLSQSAAQQNPHLVRSAHPA